MTGDARQRRRVHMRAGVLAAAVATALLAAVCGGSPAGAAPAPGGTAPAPGGAAGAGGYLYWSNTLGNIAKPGNGVIGRARLDGTDVNQGFVTKKDFRSLHGIAAGLCRQ
ncbi:MAG TPA: hypothetical protein VGH27_35075 [Streptosporangiaceae bacterium]